MDINLILNLMEIPSILDYWKLILHFKYETPPQYHSKNVLWSRELFFNTNTKRIHT